MAQEVLLPTGSTSPAAAAERAQAAQTPSHGGRLALSPDDVQTGRNAQDWRDALDQAAAALAAGGYVEAAYRDGLHAREAQSSTFLGNGIAIPHGTPDSRRHVHRTGIRVLQFPAGVEWHDGQRVFLLVAIAAQSDEHLDILRQLTQVLDGEGIAERLAAAPDAEAVLAVLSRPTLRPRLDADTLSLRLPVRGAGELAAAAAARLHELGCVDAGFVAAIATQEPFPLGQGLWLAQSAAGVQGPALALATAQRAVSGPGGSGQALFCLAAHGDAHLPLLQKLDDLLDSGEGARLHELGAEQILALLAGESAHARSASVRLLNAHGLHARPAKQLVEVARAQGLPIRLKLAEGGKEPVDATSLIKVLGLGARRGQSLVFSAQGDSADAALAAVVEAVQSGLGEAVVALAETAVTEPLPDTHVAPPQADQPLAAVPASPGMAVAPLFVLRAQTFDYPARAADPQRQRQRLQQALGEASGQVDALIAAAPGSKTANILSVHVEMLGDRGLLDAAVDAIDDGASAEAGWWRAVEAAARAQEALPDRLLAERAADLRDIGRRVLGLLCGTPPVQPPPQPYVLVAEDLGPSDVARLDTAKVRALVTAQGGATSHSAILARALGIPAVVGAGMGVLALDNGAELIVDGETGRIVVSPSPERRERARRRIDEQHAAEQAAWEQRMAPAVTRDGRRLEVAANLGSTAHAIDAVERGAEGVGLLRTEFVFMAHADFPDLDTQVAEYGEAFDALDGRPLVARTLDVGGDKPLPYWPIPHEENPFLGMRGIRLALARPHVLETQLRALLTAAGSRPLRIMFPMVKDIDEFRAGKAIFDRLQAEIGAPDVQLGVMIEVPSCALLAPSLAAEVDFFSIGTNDLTQYTLAIDRGHAGLSAQSDAIHPAVLQLIRMTVEAADRHGRWVGVCGELASDPLAIPVLVGLGVGELSVSARRIPLVKAAVRALELPQARRLAELALAQPTADAVREALERELG